MAKKLSGKRVQEMSKLADEISVSLKKRKCEKDEAIEGEKEAGK